MLFNLLESAKDSAKQNDWTTYLFLGIMVVVLIGMFVWQSISNKKRRKEAEAMVTGLKKGDRVKTIGGICGFVVEINDAENSFVLETGTDTQKSYVKFDKAAIYQTAPNQGAAVEAKEEKAEKTEEEK